MTMFEKTLVVGAGALALAMCWQGYHHEPRSEQVFQSNGALVTRSTPEGAVLVCLAQPGAPACKEIERW